MSDISLYPQYIDAFDQNINATGADDNRDDVIIYAEDMNKVQNAIVAIQNTLGTNPQGEYQTVSQGLYSLNKSKAFSLPRIVLYNGNPLNVNGSATIKEAALYFNYVSIAILDDIDWFSSVANDILSISEEVSGTKFYAAIDAGVSTSNLSLDDITAIVVKCKESGIKGIWFNNFGYDCSVSRVRQNALITIAHDNEMPVIVSSTYIDHAFGIDNISGMNPDSTETLLTNNDGYLFLGYVVQGNYYQNAAELIDLSQKMVDYRSAYGVSMYGIAYINGSDDEKAKKFYFAQAVAALFSLNGLYACEDPIYTNILSLYRSIAIPGSFYEANPIVNITGTTGTRMTNSGKVTVNFNTNTYSFENAKIPFGFIDMSDDATISASKLTGTMPAGVVIDVISRINNDVSASKISSNKIDLNGTKVIDSINLVASGTTKISAEAISNLSSSNIESAVILALANSLESKLGSGTLDANFRKLMAQFISSQNAYFGALTAEGATFNGLNAGVITTGYIAAKLLATNTITSDKLTIHANGGLNKWAATVVLKTPGEVTNPGPSNVLGKDPYRKTDVPDAARLTISDSIGSSLNNYVVMWETSVFCSGSYSITSDFTANSAASIWLNGAIVTSVVANQTAQYTLNFHEGVNKIQIYQDHNSEMSCTLNTGIKLSDYTLQSEKDPLNSTPITRMDAYSDNVTQIIGDIIKTGTVTAEKIQAGTLTSASGVFGTIDASSINAGNMGVDRLVANVIEAINLKISNADLANADIDNLTADQVLVNNLAAKVIDTLNLRADTIDIGEAKIGSAVIGELTVDHIKAAVIDAINLNVGEATIKGAIIEDATITNAKIDRASVNKLQITDADVADLNASKINAGYLSADRIEAGSLNADKITAGTITADRLNADEVSAGLVDAGMVQAIEAYIQKLSATEGEFEKVLAELLSSKFIDTSNIKIVSEANDGTNPGQLIIDNGGLIVSSTPKELIAVPIEVMTHVSGTTFRATSKYAGLPTVMAQDPAPTFSLRDNGTLGLLTLNRDQYALIYEYGQITIDPSVSLANQTVIASYSYPAQYYPSGSRIVKIDREGIKISNDGGRPGSWTTKLDGNRLYVGEADISDASITNAKIKDGTIQTAKIGEAQITNALIDRASANKLVITNADIASATITSAKIHDVSADKITTGTLVASESLAVTAGGGIITLDERGLISQNFTIGTDGNVSITGTMTAAIGSKIANWNIGADTIYDTANRIVLNSSIPSINIDSGKVILGLYDGTNYGILAQAGKIGGLDITTEGIKAIIDGTLEQFNLTPTTISLSGEEALTINTGTMVVKDGGKTYVGVGKLDTSTYGMKINLYNTDGTPTGKYIQIDQNGLRAFNGTINTIDINKDGTLSVTGAINATSGTFTGTVNIGTGGQIKVGSDIVIDTNGLTMNKGSININSKFGVTTGGVMTATGATVTGTVNATGGYFGTAANGVKVNTDGIEVLGTGVIKNANTKIERNKVTIFSDTTYTTPAIIMGLYDGTNYGLKAGSTIINASGITIGAGSIDLGNGVFTVGTDGKLHSADGDIAGWTITANTIIKGSLVLDSAAEKITTTGAVFGQYETGKYGIKVDSGKIGGWTIAENALSTPNISIESDAELIDIAGEVSLGKYDSVTPKYGLKAGDVVLDSTGLFGTGYSLSANGLIVSKGTVGGWTLSSSEIKNTDGTFILDSTNGILKLATNKIVLNKDGSATIGKFSIADTGAISAGSNFSIDASGNLTLSGAVTATSGSFTGTINATAGWFGTTTNHVSVSGNGLQAGNVVIDNTGLKVGSTLTIDANGLTIANGSSSTINLGGKFIANSNGITSIAGTIGGWTIGQNTLVGGNITLDSTTGAQKISIGTNVVLNNDGSATIGKFTVAADGTISTASNNFTVDANGKITAIGGTIGGFSLSSSTLSANTNSIILDASGYKLSFNSSAAIFGQYATGKYGMKVGNFVINGTDSQMYVGTDYTAAKFKIDLATGNATLSNATFSGSVTSTSGSIAGWIIGTTTLSKNNVTLDSAGSIKLGATNQIAIDATNGINVASGKFTVNLAGHMVAQDAVITGSMTATTGAIGGWNIDTSTITAGSLTLDSTGSIKAGTATDRVEINSNGVQVIKAGNVVGSAITPDGIYGQLLVDQTIIGTKFDKTAPAIPANVAGTSTVEQTATSEFINISVSWTAVTDTDQDLAGYKVYLKEGTGNFYPQAIVPKTTSYVIRNVKGATNYTVGVSSYDLTGNESALGQSTQFQTVKDTKAPHDVTGLAVVDGIKMFYIKWNPVTTNSDGTTCADVDYYELERSVQGSGTWTPVNKTYSTSVVDKDVAYDTYYQYHVRAVDLSGNASGWVQIDAGKPPRVGSADIVAGSITAEVLNVGSMVKNINPNRTILFHFDGVLTSTQDMRPVNTSGGAWVTGKFGNAIALEEATENLISTLTQGNSGFSNGTTGWTANGVEYKTSGGVGGASDGYVEVNSTNKISISATGLLANTTYTFSLYAKNAVFNEPTDLVVKKGTTEVIRSTQRSDWNRVKYTFTTGAAETSVTFEFSSIDARKVGVDNVQLEKRDFMTAHTESYNLDGHIRPHGWVMYSSEKLNTKQGIVSFWYKPNRNGKSPTQTSRALFCWGTATTNRINVSLDDTNKPILTIASGATIKAITHANAIDSNDWNLITARWNCDSTTEDAEKYMDITLNGEPTVEADRISLVGFTAPDIAESYFTVGNCNNDTHYSANGYFDEFKIDISINMDAQEREEIISWYKQGSTFYDASSQIDADSQGISAANAKIRINNEGITVQDGLIKVIADDGITLIGGGRINVNGMNVGIVQSDNAVRNGNFTVTDTLYGLGDMYLGSGGIESYGAKWWISRRSSGPSYSNVVQQAAWAQILVNQALDWNEIYNQLFGTYNTAIRAQEAATHTIENTIRATPPVSTMPAGAAKEAVVADALEDELVYQIAAATDAKFAEWKGDSLAALRYNDANGSQVIKIVKYDIENSVLQYAKHSVDPYTGKFFIDPNEIDTSTLLPKLYEATEAAGIFGHTIFEPHPYNSYLGKTGYAKLGINTVNENPTTSAIGVGNGSNKTFTIPGAPIANILAITVNGTVQIPNVQYSSNLLTGAITFVTAPAAGTVIGAMYNTIDYTHQYTSIEQNLGELITYTDGLQEEGTHWKQHVFTFYAKWLTHPVGSQSKAYFEVDELVPKYTVDANNMATLAPEHSIVTPNTVTDWASYLIANTDFVGAKYRVCLGHARFTSEDTSNYKTYEIDSVRYASILPLLKVRYIRDWSNGSTANTSNHWVEILAVDALGNTVSVGKTVTGSDTVSSASNATNGNMSDFASISATGTPEWIQVDLGQVCNLGAITVWHYFLDGRTYHGTRTQVSEDGSKWYDVYNSAYQGEYAETAQGHTIGGVTGSTPNPIIVEEVLTTEGESTTNKTGWTIKTDGAGFSGMTDSNYLCSTKAGDLMMLEFTSDVDTDMTLHVLEGPQMGRAVLYVDGQYYAESDTSYPVQAIAHMQYNGAPAGSHRISVITTDVAGYNTTTDTPVFALDGVDLYEWSDVVYTTSVEYEEVDPTTWNKVVIRPDKTNTKASGVPAITAENVPVKYRARVRFDKPDGDPYSASVLVTDVQAEVGFNESFTRINYGPASFPAAMIQPYNGAVVGTGITAQHLQEYNPGFHTKETGVQERHLADGSVTTYKLGNSAVTADKIASGNISYEKLATSGKVKLQMNVALADYDYPIILPTNIDPAVRYIPCDVDAGSEDIYVNGQQQYPDEDYTVTRVVAAQRMDDVTKVQYATKITFLRPISATDKVWATYWQPI